MTKAEILRKQKEKINDIEIAIKKIPYEICYYTEVILKNGLIETTDLELPLFDEFLRKVEKCPNKKIIRKVISYNVGRILRREWKDGKDFDVEEKFVYFRRAIINGFISQNADEEFINTLCSNNDDETLPF